MPFDDGDAPTRFTEKKLASLADVWTLDDIVRAQNMECDGASDAEIAAELGRTIADVRQALNPRSPASMRPEFAQVGFAHWKGRR